MDSQDTNTPTPSNTPEPAAPETTTPAPATTGTPSPAGKGPSKGLVIGLVAGGAALILIIIAVIVIQMFSISRKDYQDALSQYNKVAQANYTLNSKVSSLQYGLSSGTETAVSNDINTAKKAIDGLREENEKLGKLKAVTTGEGKEKYDAFDKKLQAYTDYASSLLTSINDAKGASSKCGSSATSSASTVAQVKAAIDACIAALDKVSDTPDSDVKAFVGTLRNEYKKLSDIVAKISANGQNSSLRSEMYDILDNISSAATDFKSNLEKHADAVDPKAIANDLGKFLQEKSTK